MDARVCRWTIPFLVLMFATTLAAQHPAPAKLVELQLEKQILDSEQATLYGRIAGEESEFVVEIDWGDSTSETKRLKGNELKIAHDFDVLGVFRVEVKICVPRDDKLECGSPEVRAIKVVDDDHEEPVVELDMPRGVISAEVPRKISWKIDDPSGLKLVRLDLSAPDGFQTSFESKTGELDFGDRGLGNYEVLTEVVDADDDRPGDSIGGPFMHFFIVTGDPDKDGIDNHTDNCPQVANKDQLDRDNDGEGDACDLCPGLIGRHQDSDEDGVGDACDNCLEVANKEQSNLDGDLLGDACDADADNDGLSNEKEKGLRTDPLNRDTDGGGLEDGLEIDRRLDPRNPRDDPKESENVVNAFVEDRLLLRFPYNLPREEIDKLAERHGAKLIAGSTTTGIYELQLSSQAERAEVKQALAEVRGEGEEGHADEQLVYPVNEYLGTFEDLHHKYIPSDPRFADQTGFPALLGAWKEQRGNREKDGVVIALIDTGLDLEHPDLRDNLWLNPDEKPGDSNGDGCPGRCKVDDDGDGLADFDDPDVQALLARGFSRADAARDDDENGYPDDFNGWDFAADTADVSDLTGHGTHVAGIVGAVGSNQEGVAGVMWETRLMPLKVAREKDGLAPLDAILDAMVYAGQNGADIILHSYVITLEDPALEEVADLRALFGRTGTKHIFHVAAAGNQSRDLGRKRTAPELGLENLLSDRREFVFPVSLRVDIMASVAALDESGEKLAKLSNRGEGVVQMAAPGMNLLSTLPGGKYGYRSGTSMAAAYLTGVVGLLMNHYPELRGKPVEMARFLDERGTELGNPEVLTNLFYQFTHPPILSGALYDETPFRFPVGFCGHNTYDADLVDADGDGDLDILEVNGNPGSSTNDVFLYLNDGSGRFVEDSAKLGAAATGLNVIAADHADLDNDGDKDLILASFTPPAPVSNRKNVLLINNGGGNFIDGSSELPDNFDVSRDVDFCDFDGDGFVDIFATNTADDRVLRNNLGSDPSCLTNPATRCFIDMTATWLAGAAVGTGHNSQCVDIDSDGDPDVVTLNLNTSSATGNNRLLLNQIGDPAAAFVDGTAVWALPATPDASHTMAAAFNLAGEHTVTDLDDDSLDGIYGGAGDDADLVIGRRQHGAAGTPQNNLVMINLGTTLDDETFGPDDVPGTAPDRLPNVTEASTEMALCDIDGDGDLDLIEANGDANYEIWVQNRFYRNRTDTGVDPGGTGYFADQTSSIGIPVGYLQQSTDVDCGDLDGDNDIDVLFANYGGCPEIYINSTNDTAPTIASMTPGVTLVGERIIIKGTNFGPFQGAAGGVSIGGVDTGTVYHWTDTRITVQVPVGCDGNGTPGTCNGMGVPTPLPKGIQPVVVTTATNRASAPMNVEIGCFGGAPVGGVCPGNLQNFTIATVGLDADCSDDGGTNPCLPAPFSGTSIVGFNPRDIKDVEFGDIDDDGDLDIFDVSSPSPIPACGGSHFPDRLLLNDGTGRYSEQLGPLFLSSRSYDADLADINNDGFLDMVRADYKYCPGEDHYFITNGPSPLTFSGGALGIIPNAYWCEVTPGDVDGDGDLDLLFARASAGIPNAIQINRHHQGGDCVTPNDCFETWDPLVAAPTHCEPADCKDDFSTYLSRSHDGLWIDLDGDRDLDIVLGGGTGQGPVTPEVNAAYLNRLVETGEMFFEQIPIPNEPTADPTVGVIAADFNGDGRMDIHLANYNHSGTPDADEVDKVYFNLGLVECGSPEEAACPDGLSCPACPGPDHVVCNRICWLDGTPQLPESLSSDPLLLSYGSDYGDIDGDGDLDFITTSEFSNDSHVMVNQGFPASTSTAPTWVACPSMTGVAACPLPAGAFPGSLTTNDEDLAMYFGDIDSDGDLDIIWGTFNPSVGPHLFVNQAVP